MRMAFLGSKSFGLSMLKTIYQSTDECRVICPLDTDDARSCLNDFNCFARRHDLDILVAASQSSADEMLREYRPDVVLVCGWYWLIGREILNLPPLGVFGIHNSLLPRYRGGSPLVWAIINGEPTVGTTVFQFCDGVDNGPILEQVEVPLADTDSIGDALRLIETSLLDTFPDKWLSFLRGEIDLVEQNDNQATYCGQRIPDDGHIDWTQPAQAVHNFVRAQSSPYPGAFCYLEERKITIWKTAVDSRTFHGVSGQILSRSSSHVVISCGDQTALKIFAITVDGIPNDVKSVFRSVKLRLS